MAHQVFVSHSAKDKNVADAVVARLERDGLRCWVAPRDIIPGSEWSESIVQAIEDCGLMLLVFSRHANASPQIKREVERAVHHGVAILPFRIDDVLPSRSLEYFISASHWLDALTPPVENHLDRLATTVSLILSAREGDPSGHLEADDTAAGDEKIPASGRGGRRGSRRKIATAAAIIFGALLLGILSWSIVTNRPWSAQGKGEEEEVADDPGSGRNPGNGAPDVEFGVGGRAILPSGPGMDEAYAVAVRDDGRIVVAGQVERAGKPNAWQMAVARFRSDGQADPEFGENGLVTTAVGRFDDGARDLALQRDGKIVVAGRAERRGYGYDFGLCRYLADGKLDPSFGEGGMVVTNVGSGQHESAEAECVELSAEGRIVVAGNAAANGKTHVAIARYDDSGKLDRDFGTNLGLSLWDVSGGVENVNAMKIQGDGKIVAVGSLVTENRHEFLVLRFLENGKPDSEFGDEGAKHLQLFPENNEATAVQIQPDGAILVAGYAVVDEQSGVVLVRLLSSGQVDEGFGSGGVVKATPAGNFVASAMLLDDDANLLIALHGAFGLMRLKPDGRLDQQFGSFGFSRIPSGDMPDYSRAMAFGPNGVVVLAGASGRVRARDFAVARFQLDRN